MPKYIDLIRVSQVDAQYVKCHKCKDRVDSLDGRVYYDDKKQRYKFICRLCDKKK